MILLGQYQENIRVFAVDSTGDSVNGVNIIITVKDSSGNTLQVVNGVSHTNGYCRINITEFGEITMSVDDPFFIAESQTRTISSLSLTEVFRVTLSRAYRYRIRAVRGTKFSEWSDIVKAT